MSVRELALICAVAMVCVAGLAKPRVALYGYISFSLLRPDELAWCEGRYPFSAALALCTLAGSIRFAPNVAVLFRSPIVRLLLLLQIPIALSVLFPVGPFLAPDRYGEYMRMMLMVLLIPILIRTREHVRTMLLVMAFSLGILGLKFGSYGISQGGVQYAEGLGNQYDNNTLGMAMAMGALLCWRCAPLAASRWTRLSLWVMGCTATATAVMTNSRGASLSLAAGCLYLVARSRHKTLALVAVVLASLPAVYLVREEYFARMSTIATYKQEASAASRIEFARASIDMWRAYPLLGVGFGSRNFIALNRKFLGREDVHAAHNTYLQMLADSGVAAYLIYATVLFGTMLWLHRMTKAGSPGGVAPLASVINAPLIAFVVGGTFGSMQRYDLPYMLLACAAALHWAQRGQPGESGGRAAAEVDAREEIHA